MLTIEYGNEGLAVPDAGAEEYIRSTYACSPDAHVKVSTSALHMSARVLVREGVIPVDAIQFTFNGAVIPHDKDGRLSHWPDGCDTYLDNFLNRLMGW